MYTSFSTALTALSAYAQAVDVVGNNLANLNTTGFKASTVAFSDLVAQQLGSTELGFGVAKPTTIRQFSQGAIQSSSGALDAAIQGDGFMIVKDNASRQLYTRGGNLTVDKNGVLMTPKGHKVQGWAASGGVLDTSGGIGDITVPVGSLRAPVATTALNFDLNLNSGAATGDTFSSSVEVYDSLGVSHVVTVKFTKSATANQWNYAMSVPDADVSTPITPVTGSVTFNSSGALTSPLAATAPPQIVIGGLLSGAATLTVDWQLYKGTAPRLTQYAQPSAVSAMSQTGSPAAQLLRVAMADGGRIVAQFSGGPQVVVGQLAMAGIRNPESLLGVGDNNYLASPDTAPPAIGTSGTGGRGQIVGGAVEASTVDIAKEFTNLIVLQRGYQANTRVITTMNEISQETINLKR